MKYIDLPVPHGFLIWRGKQTAIAMHRPIEASKVLIVSNGEAYGEATLSKPIAVNTKEFDRRLDSHCVKELERKLWWPDNDAFYIHDIKNFDAFSEPVLFEDGEMVDYKPTEKQQKLIEQAKELPKEVCLDDSAVVVCGDGQHIISDKVKGMGDIERILEAGIKANGNDDDALSVYKLALVRTPRMVVKKKEIDDIDKQEDMIMPYAIADEGFGDCEQIAVVKIEDEEVMGCHETMDEAQAQLDALNIAEAETMMEEEESAMEEEKQEEELEQAIIDAGGKLDEIIALYVNDDNGDEYYANVGDLAEQETIDAIKKVFSSVEIEAETPPPEGEAWRIIWPEPPEDEKQEDADGELLQERLESVRGAFNAEFNDDERWANYMVDATNNYVIAEMEGVKYRIPYEQVEGDIIFSSRDEWIKVKVSYTEKAGKRLKTAMLKRLREAMATIKDLIGWAEYDDDKSFGIDIKEVNGEPWHFMWSTNAFEDREKEIFSTKALDQFANEVNEKEEKGYFNFWHIPGTDFAEKKFIETVGRFLIEAGPYLKDEKGRAALEFFKEYKDGHPDFAPEGWGSSPEFRFNLTDRDDGVYDWLWIDRTSTLPRAAAANVYTSTGQQEVKMSTLEGQRKDAAVALFGEEFIENLLKDGDKRTTTLEEAGVAHKENKPVDIEQAIKTALKEQVEIDLSAITEVMTALKEKVDSQEAELQALRKEAKVKEESETPRFVLQLTKRASEASETEVGDGDELKNKKPAETPTDKSMAAAYFGR